MRLFETNGPANTTAVAALAIDAARQRGIEHIVVATCTGRTVRHLLPAARDFRLTAVTHACGFASPGVQEMAVEARSELEAAGVRVLTTTHVLSGAERGLSRKFGGIGPVEVIANALRMFGQGVKVGVEVAVMALDAGVIPFGRDVLAIGGTNEGADTAIVVRPAHANAILDTRVVEIICMPRP
jgi:hypothetical protein